MLTRNILILAASIATLLLLTGCSPNKLLPAAPKPPSYYTFLDLPAGEDAFSIGGIWNPETQRSDSNPGIEGAVASRGVDLMTYAWGEQFSATFAARIKNEIASSLGASAGLSVEIIATDLQVVELSDITQFKHQGDIVYAYIVAKSLTVRVVSRQAADLDIDVLASNKIPLQLHTQLDTARGTTYELKSSQDIVIAVCPRSLTIASEETVRSTLDLSESHVSEWQELGMGYTAVVISREPRARIAGIRIFNDRSDSGYEEQITFQRGESHTTPSQTIRTEQVDLQNTNGVGDDISSETPTVVLFRDTFRLQWGYHLSQSALHITRRTFSLSPSVSN